MLLKTLKYCKYCGDCLECFRRKHGPVCVRDQSQNLAECVPIAGLEFFRLGRSGQLGQGRKHWHPLCPESTRRSWDTQDKSEQPCKRPPRPPLSPPEL